MSIQKEYGDSLQTAIDKAEAAATNEPFNTFYVVELDNGEGRFLEVISEKRCNGCRWWHDPDVQNFDPFIVYETR